MDMEVQFQAVGQQFEGIEVPNMDYKNSKISFEVQNVTSAGDFKNKMTSQNILEYSRIILV